MRGIVSAQNLPRGVAVFVIIAAVSAVFGPILSHDFINYDDDTNIYENPLMNPPTASSLVQTWKAPYFHMYIPVTRTLWTALAWIDVSSGSGAAGRLSPIWFHGANLVVHLLNSLLVFMIVSWLMGEMTAALLGALVFAIHPLQVETVAWATGFKDLLSTFFGLVTVYLVVRLRPADVLGVMSGGVASRKHMDQGTAPAGRVLVGASMAFALALLAKPNIVVVGLLIVWLAVVLRQHLVPMRWFLVWAVLGVVVVLVNAGLQPAPPYDLPLWKRWFVASDALAFYLGKLVFPVHLVLDHGRRPDVVLARVSTYWLGLLPIALAIVGFAWRRQAWVGVSIGWFCLGLLPVLGLVPFGFQSVSTVADRYVYLAMLALALMIAVLSRKSHFFRAFSAVAILVFAVLASQQVQRWQGPTRLYEYTLVHNPSSRLAHFNLSTQLIAAGRYPEAEVHLQKILEINSDDEQAQLQYGRLLRVLRRFEAALRHLEAARRLDPGDPAILLEYGHTWLQSGQPQKALAAYDFGLQRNPRDILLLHSRGVALASMGHRQEAQAAFEAVLVEDPSFVPASQALEKLLQE